VITGETNGKSNNLNHCLTKVIYKDFFPTNPQGPKIPKTEVCCTICNLRGALHQQLMAGACWFCLQACVVAARVTTNYVVCQLPTLL
jgi:hypothetical protein